MRAGEGTCGCAARAAAGWADAQRAPKPCPRRCCSARAGACRPRRGTTTAGPAGPRRRVRPAATSARPSRSCSRPGGGGRQPCSRAQSWASAQQHTRHGRRAVPRAMPECGRSQPSDQPASQSINSPLPGGRTEWCLARLFFCFWCVPPPNSARRPRTLLFFLGPPPHPAPIDATSRANHRPPSLLHPLPDLCLLRIGHTRLPGHTNATMCSLPPQAHLWGGRGAAGLAALRWT